MLPSVLSLGLMLCALYISCEEEAHTDEVPEKTDAPVDKEAAWGYVTSLDWSWQHRWAWYSIIS